MQRVIEEDVLGTSAQGRRLPRTNPTRAVVRQIAFVKRKQHVLVTDDAFVAIRLIFLSVTLDPIMFQKNNSGSAEPLGERAKAYFL